MLYHSESLQHAYCELRPLQENYTETSPGLFSGQSATMETDNGALVVEQTRTSLMPKHERDKRRREKEAQRDYGRGRKVNIKGIRDKKLRRNLQAVETKFQAAALKAKDAEILLEETSGYLEPENELERTYKVTQDEIQENVSITTAQKRFDLTLNELGPYVFDYTRNGRHLLLGGRKGHSMRALTHRR